jgi:hypothetical protein
MADIVKVNDSEFLNQITAFHTFINANPTDYGFTTGDADDLKDAKNLFGTSLGDFTTKNTAARVAREKKDVDRDPAEERFRWMAGQFNKRPNVTNADRIAAGLPPKAESVGSITANLGTAPLILVEQAGIHEHVIRFFMPDTDSKSTKKPQGVDGAKIYMKIDGAPSTNLKEYGLIAFDKKSPYNYSHEAADAGKQAHYIAIWATDEEQHSGQSETFSLMIT